MEFDLPVELRLAAANARDGTVKVVDPTTHQAFYLVTATAFEELLRALQDEPGVRDFEPLLANLAPEDWQDAVQFIAPP